MLLDILSEAPREGTLCVYHSLLLLQLSTQERTTLVDFVTLIGLRRPVLPLVDGMGRRGVLLGPRAQRRRSDRQPGSRDLRRPCVHHGMARLTYPSGAPFDSAPREQKASAACAAGLQPVKTCWKR